MSAHRLISIPSILSILAVACSGELPREQRVVLEVAGDPVTVGELDRFVAASVQQESAFLAGDVMAALFEDFIEEQLLLRAAKESGIVADRALVDSRMEAIRGAEGEPLASEDEAILETVERQVRIEKLLEESVLGELAVTDEEVAAYYDTHRDYFFRPETVDLSQILVEDEALAAELRARLRTKGSSFEALAEEHSVGPEASRGGRLGTFASGELPPSFEESAFSLPPGALSDVVATDFGFHIFRVNERADSAELALEQVKDVIRVELLRMKSDEAVSAYLDELRERYPVTVHTEHLSFAFVERERPRIEEDEQEVDR